MKNKIYVFILIVLLGASILGLSYSIYASCCSSEEMCCCEEVSAPWYLESYSCICVGGELIDQDCKYYML